MNRIALPAVLVLLMAFPLAASAQQVRPDPSLSPEDVVTIVMEALKANDDPYPDYGIEVTFGFASPSNKAMTGPLARFKQMVKGPTYGLMVNHRRAVYENVRVEGDLASVDVVVTAADGEAQGFRFFMSRQHDNGFEGAWMTDAVIPFEVMTL